MSEVAQRLSNPSRQLTFEQLAAEWFAARVSARIRGYGAIAYNQEEDATDRTTVILDLLRRVRGGIGQVLIESASPEAIAGRPCPWNPPCALDVLFREQGRAGGYGIPKPYVLSAEPHGRDLMVALTLFGFATDWSAIASHALVATLQHRIHWQALRPRLFLPRLEFQSVMTRAIEGVPIPTEREIVELQFVTPMNAEGEDPLEWPATILARLGHRLRGLALWNDASIAADWGALESLRNGLWYDTALLRRRPVRRRSGQQRHYYDTDAVEGVLRVADIPREFQAMLAIGCHTHVGKGASEGLGRFLLA